jgi:hypothetical protein
MPTVQKCPDNAITSFPLGLAQTATDVLYDSVNESIDMDFQWASRSTPPVFANKAVDGTIDEVGNTNQSTLQYNNATYTVASVQIAQASHTNWILPVTTVNTEDLIIVFSNPNAIQYQYIMLVIPILRSGTNRPTYLAAIANPETPGPFTLNSCLPSQSQFAYYATCLDGYSDQATSQNIYVFLSIQGIQVNPKLMDDIAKIRGAGGFTQITLPWTAGFSNVKSSIAQDFSQYVLTTRDLVKGELGKNVKIASRVVDSREDPTSSYQCVPLNPDTDIKDGVIQVDLESGKVLSDILAERDAVRASSAPAQPNKKLEKLLGSAMGILFAILLLAIMIYFVITYFAKSKAPGAGTAGTGTAVAAPVGESWVQQIPLYGIIIIITSFIGFVVGVTVNS